MANVRLDERGFRRLDKFTNKKDDWKNGVLNFLRQFVNVTKASPTP